MAGGLRPQAYVHNPVDWVDPLGLAKCPTLTTDQNGRVVSATASVSPQDINTGTGTNASSRNYVRELGNSDDDAGHILAKALGGQGGKGNVFPQDSKINRGDYRLFEKQIKEEVLMTGKTADLEWRFQYNNGGTRPTGVVYDVYMDGNLKHSKVFSN